MNKHTPKRTYTYARVSTDYQHTDNQERYLDAWCQEHPADKVVKLKETISGRKMTGDALSTLWDAVLAGEVKRIVVYAVDRLGRNMIQALSLIRDCLYHEVEISILSQPDIKLNTPEGELMFSMLMSFAVFENAKIASRTKTGLATAKTKCARCHCVSEHNLHDGLFSCVKCGHKVARFIGGTTGQVWMTEKVRKRVDEVLRLHDAGFNNLYIRSNTGLAERTIARIIKNRLDLPNVRPRVWDSE